MANPLKKIGSYLGLVEADDDFFEEEIVEEPRSRRSGRSDVTDPAPISRIPAPAIDEPVRLTPVASQPEPMARITTLAPQSFNDAKFIGEEFRKGHGVIMNLQDLDETSTRRLVDYAAGVVHALDGKMEKVSRAVYVLSPKNLDVRDAARNTMITDGFFNQS
jgi:cell division inhibitor SepF